MYFFGLIPKKIRRKRFLYDLKILTKQHEMKGRYSVYNECYQPAASEQEDFTFHCLSIEKVSLGQGIAETYKKNMYKQS